MTKKPLVRVTGGSGTMTSPFRIRNELEWQLDCITEQGYDYETDRIAEARKLLKETKMSSEQKQEYELRIAIKEYRSKGARAGYLVRRARQEYIRLEQAKEKQESLRVIQRLTQKYKDFLEAAEYAHEEFLTFAKAHPDLKKEHERWNESYFMPPEQEFKKL